MAETAVRTKTKLGWAKSGMDSSSEEEDAIVPGVNRMGSGNLRPKLRPRRPRDMKSKPNSKPTTGDEGPSNTTTLSVQDLSQSLDERRLGPTWRGKRGEVSLKDLCVEDKRRIANLIKELAKVGEEREKAREELDRERRSYEHQILKLVEQQELILRERQEVEKQLQECQQLLLQSRPLHPPPPSFPPPSLPTSLPTAPTMAPPSVAPPTASTLAPPLLPYPAAAYPQWAWPGGEGAWPGGEGRGPEGTPSLVGNVGSPDRQRASHGYAGPSQAPPALTHPTHLSPSVSPHPHHPAGGDLAPLPPPPATHPTPHPHPAADFFTNVMQQPEPLDVFAARDAPPPSSLPAHTSKDAVIERFFASQPAHDAEPPLMSPKRRGDSRRQTSKPRPSKHGAVLKPIMSSTQKSTEIKDYLSVDSQQEFVPLVPDESSSQRLNGGEDDLGRRGEEGGGVTGRVMFAEGGKGEVRLHSPLGDAGDDGHTYHKMSQTQRKEQLLQQRAQLLEEQQRLKHILTEQEAMLRDRQRALQARTHRRHGDMEEEEEEENGEAVGRNDGGDNDDDPLGLVPQRLAIDAALERQRAIVDSLEVEAQHRTNTRKPSTSTATTTTTSTTTRLPNNAGQGEERRERARGGLGKEGRRREKGGKSVVEEDRPLGDVVKRLDYSLHSDSEDVAEDNSSDGDSPSLEDREKEGEGRLAENVDEPSPPVHQQDAWTSVSYHTIARSPAAGKGSATMEVGAAGDLPSSTPLPTSLHTPGEKTMSVLEIINSLHTPPHPAHDLRPAGKSTITQHLSSPSRHRTDSPPLTRWRGSKEDDLDIVIMDSSEDDDVDDEDEVQEDENDVIGHDDLEESQILEDIFFLK